MTKIGRERGWPPLTRQDYDASLELRGANFVGSPEQVIEKILFQHEIFQHERFLLQITVGSMPHDKVLRAIELFGTEVAPSYATRSRAARATERPRPLSRARGWRRHAGIGGGGWASGTASGNSRAHFRRRSSSVPTSKTARMSMPRSRRDPVGPHRMTSR